MNLNHASYKMLNMSICERHIRKLHNPFETTWANQVFSLSTYFFFFYLVAFFSNDMKCFRFIGICKQKRQNTIPNKHMFFFVLQAFYSEFNSIKLKKMDLGWKVYFDIDFMSLSTVFSETGMSIGGRLLCRTSWRHVLTRRRRRVSVWTLYSFSTSFILELVSVKNGKDYFTLMIWFLHFL